MVFINEGFRADHSSLYRGLIMGWLADWIVYNNIFLKIRVNAFVIIPLVTRPNKFSIDDFSQIEFITRLFVLLAKISHFLWIYFVRSKFWRITLNKKICIYRLSNLFLSQIISINMRRGLQLDPNGPSRPILYLNRISHHFLARLNYKSEGSFFRIPNLNSGTLSKLPVWLPLLMPPPSFLFGIMENYY